MGSNPMHPTMVWHDASASPVLRGPGEVEPGTCASAPGRANSREVNWPGGQRPLLTGWRLRGRGLRVLNFPRLRAGKMLFNPPGS
jgi:hypothetical protein